MDVGTKVWHMFHNISGIVIETKPTYECDEYKWLESGPMVIKIQIFDRDPPDNIWTIGVSDYSRDWTTNYEDSYEFFEAPGVIKIKSEEIKSKTIILDLTVQDLKYLMQNDLHQFRELLLSNCLLAGLVARGAEILGKLGPDQSDDIVISTLLQLLEHQDPCVREAAVYGLEDHLTEPVKNALIALIAAADTTSGVREAAREIIESDNTNYPFPKNVQELQEDASAWRKE